MLTPEHRASGFAVLIAFSSVENVPGGVSVCGTIQIRFSTARVCDFRLDAMCCILQCFSFLSTLAFPEKLCYKNPFSLTLYAHKIALFLAHSLLSIMFRTVPFFTLNESVSNDSSTAAKQLA